MQAHSETARLNPGRRGAKAVSWETDNPRALLIALMREHPDQSQKFLYSCFLTAIQAEPSYLPALCQYWFKNNFIACAEESGDTAAGRSADDLVAARKLREQHTERVKAQASKLAARVEEVVLLSLLQPNGKPLRACTGLECRKFGGWYEQLAKLCGKRLVGVVLSEAEVRALAPPR